MLDVGDIISITEMFVLVSATNPRQVKTIAEEVELALKVYATAPDRARSRASTTPRGCSWTSAT